MCARPADLEELKHATNGNAESSRGLASATMEQRDVHGGEESTWRAFVLVALPVEAAVWEIEQAIGRE
jgi:hypothetical protein